MFENNNKLEVVFKYVILVLLIASVTILFVSGMMFLQGDFGETSMDAHMVAGIMLVALAIVHTYIKRRKLKKLTRELKNIIKGEPVQLDCNTARFINALKDVSVSELSDRLGADVAEILNRNGIKVGSKSENLGQVCENNDEKMFYIFVVLVEEIFAKEGSNLKKEED